MASYLDRGLVGNEHRRRQGSEERMSHHIWRSILWSFLPPIHYSLFNSWFKPDENPLLSFLPPQCILPIQLLFKIDANPLWSLLPPKYIFRVQFLFEMYAPPSGEVECQKRAVKPHRVLVSHIVYIRKIYSTSPFPSPDAARRKGIMAGWSVQIFS